MLPLLSPLYSVVESNSHIQYQNQCVEPSSSKTSTMNKKLSFRETVCILIYRSQWGKSVLDNMIYGYIRVLFKN